MAQATISITVNGEAKGGGRHHRRRIVGIRHKDRRGKLNGENRDLYTPLADSATP